MALTLLQYRQVAALHASCIDQGFLGKLGTGFLALLYEAIDGTADAVLLVESAGEEIVGFVAGTQGGLGPIYRRLLRRPLRLAWALRGVLVSPRKIRRILEVLRHGAASQRGAQLPDAELLSIAVAPPWRGRGISERLYRRLLAHFADRQAGGICIIVGDALETAHRFYRRMGAMAVAQTQVHGGVSSTVYVQRLHGERDYRPC